MHRLAEVRNISSRPEHQKAGIGSALIREGLEVCRSRGESIVIVVGHSEYYPRFGFSAELARNLRGPFYGEAWRALELAPGALCGPERRRPASARMGIDELLQAEGRH